MPRGVMDAVNAARPIVARLDTQGRDKNDVAADIVEAWGVVENGLRSLVGGTTLSGQALIRELRTRQFLSLEQANALAQFQAARDRAGRFDYTPTGNDTSAVRDAFAKLETVGVADAPRPVSATASPVVSASPAPAELSAARTERPKWLWPVVGLVALLVIAGGYMALASRGGSASYDEGVTAYKEGRREAAQGLFRKAASDQPSDPMPHVYLARMEREAGNLGNANAEAVKAVELGQHNSAALRELASTLFAQQNYDGARTFYIRTIKEDTTDRVAQGYLGCSLVRLGRFEEGAKWIGRAGTGAWSSCSPAATPAANPAVPMTVPRQ